MVEITPAMVEAAASVILTALDDEPDKLLGKHAEKECHVLARAALTAALAVERETADFVRLAEDHYWDSLEPQKDLVLAHIRALAVERGVVPDDKIDAEIKRIKAAPKTGFETIFSFRDGYIAGLERAKSFIASAAPSPPSSQGAISTAEADAKPCTCHPDDNPPVPCPRKYALRECRMAAARSRGLQRAAATSASMREECAKVADDVAFYEDEPDGPARRIARAIRTLPVQSEGE